MKKIANKKEAVKNSRERCKKTNLIPYLSAPGRRIEYEEWKKKWNKWQLLITIFRENYRVIKSRLNKKALVMLVDSDLFALKVYGSDDRQKNVDQDVFIDGISLAEEDAGTNAVALAAQFNETTVVNSNDHYCKFLKEWHTLASPLIIGKQEKKLLTAIISPVKIKSELIALIELFNENIVLKYAQQQKYEAKKRKFNLNDSQLKIMEYLTAGLTTKEIAGKMSLSVYAVKYHKKKIYQQLQVNTINEAIYRATKNDIIPV